MNLWYTEEDQKQLRFGYKVKQVLEDMQTEFQKLEVIETVTYGKMLVLDGCVMVTENDEFVYHEMIAHIPVALAAQPVKDVLVIGGGDGGTVRELLKHAEVEKITLCEIDGKVVEVSKKHFPEVACGLSDPRVEVKIGDGVAFMKTQTKAYDLVIIDSTDPIGPGVGLFTGDFYKSVANALKPEGLMVAQSESPWYSREVLCRIQNNIRSGFAHSRSYIGSVPTYPRGLWSWTMARFSPIDPAMANLDKIAAIESSLKYLTPEMVKAAFVLPPFYADKIKPD